MASSIAGSNCNNFFFPWGHPKEQVYAVPPRATEDRVARLQAAVACLGAFERMLCSTLPSPLKWTVAALNTDCNHEVPMV
jgi:hypothetical protein